MEGIYSGKVTHERFMPTHNFFSYKYSMIMIDLDKMQSFFNKSILWSYEKINFGSFYQKDYFKKTNTLKKDVLRFLRKNEIEGIDKVYLLTTPRILGLCYNPVSFYFCYQEGELQAVISDINNTPWNQKFAYLHKWQTNSTMQTFEFNKEFHISPFMPMNIFYKWSFNKPTDMIIITMNNYENGNHLFNATMKLKKKALSSRSLNKIFIAIPLIPIQTLTKIYWNALKLWVKKTPFYKHPKK